MKIRLKKLELENFKGIKKLSLNFENKDADIYGANNSGKTTVADAFFWLLFNKNSLGQTKFDIKTLDKNGQELHNLDHSVYGVLEIDGKEQHIKKIYREKWTKKRGQATASFTGHETDYELGSTESELTPKKKKEFDEFIKSIIADESIFKLVTNPLTFNSLKQEERKAILMSLVAETTDADVIASNDKLKDLTKLLGDSSLDDFKKRLARDKKAINKSLQAIPIRVDEINHNLSDVQKYDQAKLESELKESKEEIERLNSNIQSIKDGTNNTDLMKDIQKKELDLQFIIDNHDQDLKLQIQNKSAELDIEKRKLNSLKSDEQNLKFRIKNSQDKLESLGKQFNDLKAENENLVNETKEFTTETKCDHCGQDIPIEKQEEVIQKMKDKYNLDKSNKLEAVKEKAINVNNQGKELKTIIDKDKEELKDCESLIKELDSKVSVMELELSELKGTKTSPKETSKYKLVEKELAELKQEKTKKENTVFEQIKEIETTKLIVSDQVRTLQQQLNEIETFKKAKNRIAELEGEQEKLAKQFEQLEYEQFLTEEFTKTKVDLIEDSINSKFKITKFKLFDTQINEGVNEVCEATHKGVPYNSGLNSAARLNVGLDIINALSEHYNFYAPIMIDNAESVTDILPTQSQQIRLHVSKDDKKLRLEV